MSKSVKKTIVNVLTISRIVGALTIPFIFSTANTTFLIVLLALLFITDFLDGKLSRAWGVSTVGGALLDPLGDKLLAIVCILSLIGTHIDYLILLLFELAISLLNIYRTLHGENVKSTMKGKIKTWFLSISILLGAIRLFNPNVINDLLHVVGVVTDRCTITENIVLTSLILAGIFEVFTLLSYLGETIAKKDTYREKVALKPYRELLTRLFDETRYKEDKNKPLLDIIRVEE